MHQADRQVPFGAQKHENPGPNPLPLPQLMDMHASKTLCTGLYKSLLHRWFNEPEKSPNWIAGPRWGGGGRWEVEEGEVRGPSWRGRIREGEGKKEGLSRVIKFLNSPEGPEQGY